MAKKNTNDLFQYALTLFIPCGVFYDPYTLKMLDKISICSIFFIIFHEFVTLLLIFQKPRQMNSCMRRAQKNMVITPGVINDLTEIYYFVQIFI